VIGRSVILLGTVCLLGAACGKSREPLACAQSIDAACADPANACVLNWTSAQADTSFCANTAPPSPLFVDCGPYHAVTVTLVDASRTYYYDLGSGALVAIVIASAPDSSVTCLGGPSAGFTPPICSGNGSATLPQCLDGGVADAPSADGQ
jgi:hypothetical protein